MSNYEHQHHHENYPHHNHNHPHPHFNFNNEEREKIIPSIKILSRFGLEPGQSLADLGCGQGYFTLRAAEMMGSQGIIKAVEINSERLKILQDTARERRLSERIEIYLTQGENIPLPNQDVDRVLISNVLHELKEPLNYLKDARRILKADGKIWVIEWQKKETPIGPPLNERFATEELVNMLEKSGFDDIWIQFLHPAHLLIRGGLNPDYNP